MTDLPLVDDGMDALPPAIRFRIRDVLGRIPGRDRAGGVAHLELLRLLDESESWLAADPSLAEVGYWLIDANRSVELRCLACRWLTSFPSLTTIDHLAVIARDSAAPDPVREQAIWALGHREVRAKHRSVMWSPEAIVRADDVLIGLAEAALTAGTLCSRALPEALRHVQSEGAFAVYARAPGFWGSALESFGSPALARVLLVNARDVPPRHRRRALQLCAAVLGEEAVPMLGALASQESGDDKLEILFLIVALAGETKLGGLEDVLREMTSADHHRRRARWHLQNPGVVPVVRGLRVARSTATIPDGDRTARCGQAADDLQALSGYARYEESEVYRLWAWMVRGAADPERAGALVAADPRSQYDVGELYMEDLARRGQVQELVSTACSLDALGLGAMYLAIWGKPIAALELAATVEEHSPEVVVARALGCFRAGRPDLAQRILEEDLPPPVVVDDRPATAYPGPHEQWLIDRGRRSFDATTAHPGRATAMEAVGDAPLAMVALTGGLPAVLALAKPAPLDGEPDSCMLASLDAIERRLRSDIAGATVCLLGEYSATDRRAIETALADAGARLVLAPLPGVDYYVVGHQSSSHQVAQLRQRGARRLQMDELGKHRNSGGE